MSPTAATYILDCRFGPIARSGRGSKSGIALTVGAVESGLFVGRSSLVVVASTTGVEVLTPPPRGHGQGSGMRKISLVVSDVDGTLVTTDKALTPRAVAAVAGLHAARASIFRSAAAARPSDSAC